MGAASYAPSNFSDFIDSKVNTAEAPVTDYFTEHPYLAMIAFGMRDGVVKGFAPIPIVNDLVRGGLHPGSSIRGAADLFRFGAGFAETAETGSPGPAVRDVIRGVNIVALLWGAKNMAYARARLAVGGQEAQLLCDVPGGACAPMSATYLLRKSGRAPRIAIAELVKASGGDPAIIADYQMGRAGVLDVLDKLKIPYRRLTHPSSMAELETIVRAQREAAMFGIEFKNGERHALVAFVDEATGAFRIWDRTGKIVASLGELESSYPGIGKAVLTGPDPAKPLIVIDGLSVGKSAAEAGGIALKLTTILAISRADGDPQMVAEGIEAKCQRADGNVAETVQAVPIIGGPTIVRRQVAPRPEWLTGVKYRLNHLGYGAGRVEHLYDERCRSAIRTFQHDYHLKVDAVPGPKTQARLAGVCGY